MRVVCINNGEMERATSPSVNLIVGKSYEVISQADSSYRIKNEKGDYIFYHQCRFKSVEEVREEKINSILR